jgi:hypothetical protein
MADIITLSERRPADRPDPAHVVRTVKDGAGVVWFEFACRYIDQDGVSFGFTIWATSHADAEKRVVALGRTATVDGQIFGTVPA